MEAFEVVRLFVNKVVVPAEPKRRGNPGYGRLRALRVLVYAGLKGLANDTRIVEHLKKRADVCVTLGLRSVPDRTTVGRWWSRYFQPSRGNLPEDVRNASTWDAEHDCGC